MKNVKRFLSLALVLVMMLSVIPAQSFAAEETEEAYVAVNTATNEGYSSVTAALEDAAAKQIIKLQEDVSGGMIAIPEKVTLDLNGYALDATYIASFGNVIDSSEENTGILNVDKNRLILRKDNAQLPIQDGDGYRFVEITKFNYANTSKTVFVFQPLFEAAAVELLKSGSEATGVTVQVQVSWVQADGIRTQNFTYNDTLMETYLSSFNAETGKFRKMFTLTLNNADNFEGLTFTAQVAYNETQVVLSSDDPVKEEEKAEGNVTTDANGQVVEQIILDNGGNASAVVSTGTQLSSGTNKVTLSATKMEETTSNVTLGVSEQLQAVDVHVEGVSEDNTVPVIVTLDKLAPEFLNQGNLKLYHVEKGETVEMTRVYALSEVDEHNEYYYDIATGTITMALATFSEVAVVSDTKNVWGGVRDTNWYNTTDTSFKIYNADQLAGLGAIVGGMAEGIEADSFAEKTVTLMADVDLGDDEAHNDADKIFYPIGYYSSDKSYDKSGVAITSGLKNFEGTFDGNGNTVSNFYQNTWEMKGDHDWYDATLQYYRDGMGLFGRVYGGTIKNLTVENFSSDGEIATTGVIAAYADFGATFENITIFNCNPRVYNIGNGGIVGCVGWYTKGETDKKVTFSNITVDNSNKISALWGSYDVACGGIVGQYYPTSGQSSANYPVNAGISFVNCHVAAQMDVYNDVCANYQYYAYRYTGMLIGSVRENETIDGHVYPKMDGITASGCTVHFGDWNDYYYCELVANSLASYTHDHQFSRLEQVASVDEKNMTVTTLKGDIVAIPTSGRVNYVVVNGNHATENATCYHFVDGEVWTHEKAGTETVDGVEGVPVEDKQHIYLEFNNLVTGYGWGVTSRGFSNLAGVTNLDIGNSDDEASVEKFEPVENAPTVFNPTQGVTIGELFAQKGTPLVSIKGDKVQVFVSAADASSTVAGIYEPNAEDWTKGTLTFSGKGKATITITDYYYCVEATLDIEVVERTDEVKFANKFTGDFLYRVGNGNAVKLGSLFGAANSNWPILPNGVSVTIKTIAGNAAGRYTSDTTWTNGEIQFTGTGVVKVTITDNDYCTPTVLNLEVVDAVNATGATSATANNVVLLQDATFGSLEVSNGYTLFGNGFTLTCGSDSVAADLGYAFVTINSGTLDNVQIVCPNFDYAALYKSNLTSSENRSQTDAAGKTRYYNARSAVMVSGNSQILNSRISGGRAALNIANGDVLVDNSRIELGAVASILVGAANSLTLRDVTLVQKPTESTYKAEGATKGTTLMGFSVLVQCTTGGVAAPITLEGVLTQIAWADENDKQYVPTDAQAIVDEVMKETEYLHDIDGDGVSESLNLGFAYMPADEERTVKKPTITDNRTNTNVTYELVEVSYSLVTAYVYSYKNTNGTDGSFKAENEYVPNKYGDIITVNYADTSDGLTTGKSFGTDGWTFELNVDLDKLSGYAVDFSKLSMTINGVPVTDFAVDGGAKPASPVAVVAGGVTYTLAATVDGKEYTALYKVTGTETSKDSPSLVASNYEAGLCIASSYGGTWSGAAPALMGIQIRYWSVAEKQYKTINLADYTPTTKGQLNGANTTWTYSPANGDFTLTLTGGQVHSSNNIYAMPVCVDDDGNYKLYFVAADSKGLVNSGNSARTIPVSYSFKDNNGGTELTFSHTWSVAENKDAQYKYSDFCKGTKTKLENCITADTLITLADGTQVRVDELTGDELLLVWNLKTGKYEAAPIVFVDSDEEAQYEIIHLYFSDGSDVKVIYEHGFFDLDLGKYVYIDATNYADYVGHRFVTQGDIAADTWNAVTLDAVVVETEVTTAWSPVTYEHLCYYTNGVLSMPGGIEGLFNIFEVDTDTMSYDAEKMQADIDTYGLFTLEDFDGMITEEAFLAFNGAYLKVAMGKGLLTWEDIAYMAERYIPLM